MNSNKFYFLFIYTLVVSFLFANQNSIDDLTRDCSEINNPEECYTMGCDWTTQITPNGIIEEYCADSDDWNDDGDDWLCEDINNLYECFAAGCDWVGGNMPGAGFCTDGDNDDEEDDWDSECSGLGYEDCEYLDFCEWLSDSDNPNSFGSCVEINDEEDDWDSECSGLGYEDCEYLDFCEWLSDSDAPNSFGSCVEINDEEEWEDDCDPDLMCGAVITCIEGLLYPTSCGPLNCDDPIGVCDEDGNGENDGPPECVLDCEGIENVSPEDDGMYFCEWLLYIFPSGCAEDCEQSVLDEIEEFMIICDECLPAGTCDNYFGEDDGEDNCNGLTLDECYSTPGCQPNFSAAGQFEGCYENNDVQGCWSDSGDYYCVGCEMFVNQCEYYECTEDGWSGPFELDECDDAFWECSDLGYEDCMDVDACDWLYDPTNNSGNCVDVDFMTGVIYGSVSYIYGDYIEFIPNAMISVASSEPSMLPYEFVTYTNEEGHFEITVPGGLYTVTAYVEEESQSLDADVYPGQGVELNFQLGEFGTGGGDGPIAVLSLGSETGIPGDTVVMPLYLESNVPVAGVQFEIASTSFETSGLLIPVGIESNYDCFTANYNNLDGNFIGIIFSLEGCEYEANEEHHIADLIFNVSMYSPIGITIDLYFDDTIVSDNFGNEVPSYGQDGQFTIGVLGDINADGEYNVLDVVVMVNYALYIETPNDLEFWAADLNQDGSINVLDVVLLVDLILSD